MVEPPSFNIEPESIDLGSIRPGGKSGPFSIDIHSTVPAKLDLTLMNVPPDHSIEGLPDTLNVGPEKVQRVQFTVKLGEGASEGVQNYKIRIVPPRELDPNPRDIQVKVIVKWTVMELVWYHVTAAAAWLYEHLLWLLLIALIILGSVYFFRRWYIYGEYPWEVFGSFFQTSRRQAVFHTPEGRIWLARPMVTLGEGSSSLKKSTATINIRREGDRHRLIVEKGLVELTDKLGLSKLTLEAGHERRLEHNDRLIMPGYQGAVVYLNSSRKS
jgi:hypothetical protein